jgi:hypothetical protein
MRRYRRIVVVACATAFLAVLVHASVAFWARHELTQPEGIIATQTLSFARQGSLYYDLQQYPYTVCAYMPVFYTLVAGLYQVGIPVLVGGRLISLLALVAILYLVWKILFLYTEEKLCAGTGVALAGMTQLLLGWGMVGQVDMLAVALTLASFYRYSRYRVLGEESLDSAAAFAVAGLLTKQTVIAAPAAILVLLALESPKRALRFGGMVVGAGGAMVLGLNALLDGRFLENTLFANLNPFAPYKWKQHFDYAAVALTPLLAVVAVGGKKALETPMRAVFVYFGMVLLVLLGTAGKVGSDSNYQIEMAVLLVVCSCLSLHAVKFFPLYFNASKSWITLLLLPLALYGVQNLRIASSGLTQRIGRERMFRAQIAELGPYLRGTGQVLSTDSNALVHSERRFEVEPLIYRLLVEAGRVNGATVLRDLKEGKFQTVLLYEDVAGKADPDPEFPRLTAPQMDVIGRRYRLVKHVPGPYLTGLYVYEPKPGGTP